VDGFFSRFPSELGLYSSPWLELGVDLRSGLDVKVLVLGRRFVFVRRQMYEGREVGLLREGGMIARRGVSGWRSRLC
jgi:hypothetical protein